MINTHRSRALARGFTLIELLVVIAIIGILSSVVLASLNTARTKGNYAAVKSNLSTIQTQAELDYDAAPNSYGTTPTAGTCTGTGMFADSRRKREATATWKHQPSWPGLSRPSTSFDVAKQRRGCPA